MKKNIARTLNIKALLEKKSFFLFGPRLTGKTTLIKSSLKEDFQFINLLDTKTKLLLLQNPGALETLINPQKYAGVIIDEIQKIPELLDEVQKLIDDQNICFLLTGSSARKLKREGVNLLGGRARTAHLFPLTSHEIPAFKLERFLNYGGLPSVYLSEEPFEELVAYVDSYLKEEIEQEARVRNLGNFSRFLKSAAMTNSELLNFAAVASDSQVSESTVRGYYQILSDTLIGDLLEPWKESKKRKAIQTAKFYFFDIGVTNAILGKSSVPQSGYDFGKLFEHFIYMEIKAALSYFRKRQQLCFWRSVNGQEVDFLVGNEIAIEVKSKGNASLRDASGLLALQEEKVFNRYLLLSNDKIRRKEKGIEFLYYKDFLKELWMQEFF
ncbi:MAG: ATP-binding protein [Oligoflexia bacterium]|nr:ATP-binding protein [Oligoflexia bacterium]